MANGTTKRAPTGVVGAWKLLADPVGAAVTEAPSCDASMWVSAPAARGGLLSGRVRRGVRHRKGPGAAARKWAPHARVRRCHQSGSSLDRRPVRPLRRRGRTPGLCGTGCRRDSPASPAGPQDGSPCGPDQRHGAGRSWALARQQAWPPDRAVHGREPFAPRRRWHHRRTAHGTDVVPRRRPGAVVSHAGNRRLRVRAAGVRGIDPCRCAGWVGIRSTRPSSRDLPRPVRGTVRHAAAATVPGISEEEFVARPGQRQTGARRTAPRNQRRVRHPDDVVAVLARTVREVEAATQRGRVTSAVRTKFQAVALLLREERARVRAPGTGSDANRTEQLKRLEGIATILATTAVRDAGLLALLAEDAVVSDAARALARDMLRAGGVEPPSEEAPQPEATAAPATPERRVVPQSVISRQLANPFLAPDFSAVPQGAPRPRRLAGWELLGPLLSSFERAGGGDSACMPLPVPSSLRAPQGLELMPHQAQLVAATAAGHRTFLLADEPGLGKTAQALLAAEAANAYPLLVVVPNVVKTNWAREAGRWTP